MTPRWFSYPLSRHGVRVVQRKLLLPVTGVQDASFHLAVAGWQAAAGLPRTGEVDLATAERLGESVEVTSGPPEWYTLSLNDDTEAVSRYLDFIGRDRAWLARLQGNMGRKPSGLIDEATAWEIEKQDL